MIVDDILRKAGIPILLTNTKTSNTITKSGWCLREGLRHIVSVDQRNIAALMEKHGPPVFYDSIFQSPTFKDDNNDATAKKPDSNEAVSQLKAPSNCFQSLCRIVAGQQLAGSAAQAIWLRLLETSKPLTPDTILTLAEKGLEANLQKPSGLSLAKAKTLVDLANHFQQETLTEEFFNKSSEEEIREALLQVKGIGPWSCDMFLMFFLERPNIFPIGDFGVRKGVAKHFGLSVDPKKGLSPTKDAQRIKDLVEPYQPYRSLLSYYMWKAAETNIDLYDVDKKTAKSKKQTDKKLKRTKEDNEEEKATKSPRPRKKRTTTSAIAKGEDDVLGDCQPLIGVQRQSPRLLRNKQGSSTTRIVTP